MPFTAEAATAATGVVHAIVGPAKILFPLADPNGCTLNGALFRRQSTPVLPPITDYVPGGGLSCPLAVGADLVYETNLLIPSYAPPVRGRIDWFNPMII